MAKVSASRNRISTDALKYRITGSTLLLAVVGIVVFLVMQPADVRIAARAIAGNGNSEADTQLPRPELVAIAVESQRLIEAMRKSGNTASNVAESAPSALSDEEPAQRSETSKAANAAQSQVPEQVPNQTKQKVAIQSAPEPAKPVVAKPKKIESASAASADSWYLQVGAFKNYTNAELLGLEARNVGFGTYLQEAGTGAGTVFKLLIGPYPTQRDALADKSKLQKSAFMKKNKIEGVFVVNSKSQS